jgi:hypothetical protein
VGKFTLKEGRGAMNHTKTIITAIALGCVAFTGGCNSNNVNASNSSAMPTVLECTQDQGQWVTIAKRGNTISSPLLIWQTAEFGDKYTPAERCKIVSERLTNFVTANGGRLQNLLLKTGTVNNQTVVCAVVKYDQTCQEDNLVLTLNQDNSKSKDQVLASFENFAKGQKTSPVYEQGNTAPMISVNVAMELPTNNDQGW